MPSVARAAARIAPQRAGVGCRPDNCDDWAGGDFRQSFLAEVQQCIYAPLVSIRLTILFVALGLGTPARAFAESHPIELFAFGDDESDYAVFAQAADPSRPTRLRFVGTAESHLPVQSEPTSEFFAFVQERQDGSLGFLAPSTDFIPLPNLMADGTAVLIPIDLSLEIAFSPERVGFFVEGGGPADQTVVRGTFHHAVVPEPGTLALASAGTAIGIASLRRRLRPADPRIAGCGGSTPSQPTQ